MSNLELPDNPGVSALTISKHRLHGSHDAPMPELMVHLHQALVHEGVVAAYAA